MIFWCLLSTLELLNVCLNVKVYWLMTQSFSTPQKWKDRSIEDLDFWLCILGLRTIKRGCSMKSWGEIKSYTILHPFTIWLRELCRNPVFGDFLGGDSRSQSQRLWPVKAGDFDSGPETLASQTRFSPEWCKPLLPLRSLWKDTPETPRLLHQGAGDSGPNRPDTPGGTGDSRLQSPETPGLVDPNG
jgi:hypothetical protein